MSAEPGPSPPRKPEASACFGFSSGEPGGGAARWDFATQWTDDPAFQPTSAASEPDCEPGPCEADLSQPFGFDPATIAKELGLGTEATIQRLTARWRAFVWRNHPDRQPAHARDWAGTRVALANALYDAARRKLAGTA